jgi:hypothetical protein
MVVQSVRDLEEQLGALIADARTCGLNADAIVHALRSKLQYAAEIDHGGHHITVQLIDLGSEEREIHHKLVRDQREILQTRSVHA